MDVVRGAVGIIDWSLTQYWLLCVFIEDRKNVTVCNMSGVCMKWQQCWEHRCARVSTGIQCGICTCKWKIHNRNLRQLSGTLDNWWSSCLEISNTACKIIFLRLPLCVHVFVLFLWMSCLKILIDNRHITCDRMNEQVTNDDQLIMWLPKMLHEAAIEFFAVWMVAPSCWKNTYSPSHQINLLKMMQTFFHNILNFLYPNRR